MVLLVGWSYYCLENQYHCEIFKKMELPRSPRICHTVLPMWKETVLLKINACNSISSALESFSLKFIMKELLSFLPTASLPLWHFLPLTVMWLLVWSSLWKAHLGEFWRCCLACILSTVNIPLTVLKISLLYCHVVTDKVEINLILINFILRVHLEILHFKTGISNTPPWEIFIYALAFGSTLYPYCF